jgi:hypothetical protein
MNDLVLDRNYRRGMKGKKVRLIQEWLCLHGYNIFIDGDFGPATESAVRAFQRKKRLKVDGIVGPKTFAKLIQPMTEALQPIDRNGKSVGKMVIAYAKQHLRQHPREIGGQNKGPWVRLYMKGHDGIEWPWCAGFVSFVLEQVCERLNSHPPLQTSFSCDSLAASAKENGIWLKESEAQNRGLIKSGSFFLSRRTPTDWVHTGIVLRAEKDLFQTIEGNTNDDGNREGYEVCQRVRGYKKKDFILIV